MSSIKQTQVTRKVQKMQLKLAESKADNKFLKKHSLNLKRSVERDAKYKIMLPQVLMKSTILNTKVDFLFNLKNLRYGRSVFYIPWIQRARSGSSCFTPSSPYLAEEISNMVYEPQSSRTKPAILSTPISQMNVFISVVSMGMKEKDRLILARLDTPKLLNSTFLFVAIIFADSLLKKINFPPDICSKVMDVILCKGDLKTFYGTVRDISLDDEVPGTSRSVASVFNTLRHLYHK